MNYPYLLIPLITYLVAQTLKFAGRSLRGEVDFKNFYRSGGMPSTHTASIVAVTTTIGVLEGGKSAVFGLAVTMCFIIIYDALGVRRSVGLQADVIRTLYKTPAEGALLNLGSAKGHSRGEVLGGVLTGLVVSLLLTAEQSLNQLGWLADFPIGSEQYCWFAGGLLTISILTFAAKRTNRFDRWLKKCLIAYGLLISLLSWSAWSGLPVLGYRLAPLLSFAGLVFAASYRLSRPPTTVQRTTVRPAPKRRKTRQRSRNRR